MFFSVHSFRGTERVFELVGSEERKHHLGGLVFKVHRHVYHPTQGSRVIKKKKKQHRGDELNMAKYE